MNRCEHGNEIYINETGKKSYSYCKECFRESERYRSLERLMRIKPHAYMYCSNEECNNIFNKILGHCKRCGSPPEELSL